jgi:hypothetical protein
MRKIPELNNPVRKRSRRRLIFIISVGAAAAFVLWAAVSGYGGSLARLLWAVPQGRPLEISLIGDSVAMGRTHGLALKIPVMLLAKTYVGGLAGDRNREELLGRAVALFGRIDRRWTAEVAALAAAAGVDVDAMMLGNCFLDIGNYRAGCRMLLTVNPTDGQVLHGHNLDWDGLGGAGQYLVTIFRAAPGEKRMGVVFLAFPGMVGALDVINEAGVALSFNQLGFPKNPSQMPVFIKMREIAESCGDFATAEAAIYDMPPGMPFCIGLSDAKSGRIAVYERTVHGEIFRREPLDGLITADNAPQAGKSLTANSMDKIVRAARPADAAEVQQLFRHPGILLGGNMYSVIFDYRANKLYLASGQIPAAAGTYRALPLFEGRRAADGSD